MISLRGDFLFSLVLQYNLRLVAQSINVLSSKNHDAKGDKNQYENRERTQCSMNTRSFIFFTRILAQAQIGPLNSGAFYFLPSAQAVFNRAYLEIRLLDWVVFLFFMDFRPSSLISECFFLYFSSLVPYLEMWYTNL